MPAPEPFTTSINNVVGCPDIRLSVGYDLTEIKTLDGDYIGSFIFSNAELLNIQTLCRTKGFQFINFYPERLAGARFIHWRILLSNRMPGAQFLMSDTTQGGSYDAGSYNPIPPKGYNLDNESFQD